MANTPFIHNPGRLLPSTAILSINEVCKIIDRDSHCWIAMSQIREYLIEHKRDYSLMHAKFMVEYFNQHKTCP